MDYKIYTTDYDITATVEDYLGHIPEAIRDIAFMKKSQSDKRIFSAVDPANLVVDKASTTTPVTILVDLSGSMRNQPIQLLAQALHGVAQVLEAQGRAFEILGFTTVAWKGGKSHKRWVEDGRPMDPGRLNERLHLIIKSMDESWDDCHERLLYLFTLGLLKENLDGEALAWAGARIAARAEEHTGSPKGGIVLLSDGIPSDAATLAVNPSTYLEAHARAVFEDLTRQDIRVQPVSLVYDHVSRDFRPKIWPASLVYRLSDNPLKQRPTDFAQMILDACATL